jgi:cytochrome oxidase assembly protein ShyY1
MTATAPHSPAGSREAPEFPPPAAAPERSVTVDGVLRTALQPRWLALLLVVLLAATGMAWLGQWQLERARLHGREPAEKAEQRQAAATPKPLEQVVRPRQTFPKDAVNTRVTATGRWDGARRLLVAGRDEGGRSGFWVLVPLRLDDGSAVPVVRGWVASATDPAASSATDQATTVVGLLQPTEPPTDRAPGQAAGLPAGQIDRVAAPTLVEAWSYPLITGFVVQQTEAPPAAPLPRAVPPPRPAQGLDLRNLSYALQWWLFAGFGLWGWWRLVRDDHLGRLRPPTDADEPLSRVRT